MKTILEFISNQKSYGHHAILLLSNYFCSKQISENDFKLIAQEFCGILLQDNKNGTLFDLASHHPDIFIADRERKVLRLEDIKKIRELSLYPPQQSAKRLFFIENCERLNANAANSLLKILEEPQAACLFLLTSRKLSLVLPTIASRVQKVALTFPNETETNSQEVISPEHKQWLKKKVNSFTLQKNSTQISASVLADVVTQCDKLAKEYQAEDLRAVLVTLINEKLKQDFSFINIAKLFLANVSEWKNHENYNPSTSLWLTRLILFFS